MNNKSIERFIKDLREYAVAEDVVEEIIAILAGDDLQGLLQDHILVALRKMAIKFMSKRHTAYKYPFEFPKKKVESIVKEEQYDDKETTGDLQEVIAPVVKAVGFVPNRGVVVAGSGDMVAIGRARDLVTPQLGINDQPVVLIDALNRDDVHDDDDHSLEEQIVFDDLPGGSIMLDAHGLPDSQALGTIMRTVIRYDDDNEAVAVWQGDAQAIELSSGFDDDGDVVFIGDTYYDYRTIRDHFTDMVDFTADGVPEPILKYFKRIFQTEVQLTLVELMAYKAIRLYFLKSLRHAREYYEDNFGHQPDFSVATLFQHGFCYINAWDLSTILAVLSLNGCLPPKLVHEKYIVWTKILDEDLFSDYVFVDTSLNYVHILPVHALPAGYSIADSSRLWYALDGFFRDDCCTRLEWRQNQEDFFWVSDSKSPTVLREINLEVTLNALRGVLFMEFFEEYYPMLDLDQKLVKVTDFVIMANRVHMPVMFLKTRDYEALFDHLVSLLESFSVEQGFINRLRTLHGDIVYTMIDDKIISYHKFLAYQEVVTTALLMLRGFGGSAVENFVKQLQF